MNYYYSIVALAKKQFEENSVKKVFWTTFILTLCLLLAACSGAGVPQTPTEPGATFTPEPTATPVVTPTPAPVTAATPRPVAKELTEDLTLTDNLGGYLPHLLDCDPETWISYHWGSEVYIESAEPIASLYLCWFREPVTYYHNGLVAILNHHFHQSFHTLCRLALYKVVHHVALVQSLLNLLPTLAWVGQETCLRAIQYAPS